MFYAGWITTISFWAAFIGLVLFLRQRKSERVHLLVTFLFLIVGIGGVGSGYGFFAGQNSIAVEPWATLTQFFSDNYAKGRTLVFVGTVLHGLFGVWALFRIRDYWRMWQNDQ